MSTKVSFIYKYQFFFSTKQSFSTRALGVKFVTLPSLGWSSLVVQLITKPSNVSCAFLTWRHFLVLIHLYHTYLHQVKITYWTIVFPL